MNPSIFRAYDIRGIYPAELDEAAAGAIAAAFARTAREKKPNRRVRIGIGRDNRTSSPSLHAAVIEAIRGQDADVVDIGLSSSPMFYFAIPHLGLDAGVMITASHNPAHYNGLKFADERGLPLPDEDTKKIKSLACGPALEKAAQSGELRTAHVMEEYVRKNLSIVPIDPRARAVRVVVDPGNGVSAPLCAAYYDAIGAQMIPLSFELDGTFPNREPNPLVEKNIARLCETVRAQHAACGIALDADGDRIVFVDENGAPVSPEYITALLAQELLARDRGARIAYDLRSTHAVPETIRANGGTPVLTRVGHTFIKKVMQDKDALFAAEVSGHYYFRDIGFFEAPLLVITLVLNALVQKEAALSALLAPFMTRAKIEETNFEVADKEAVIERLASHFAKASISRIDGITIEYPDWWCNVRPSNTENLLRLNLEANTGKLLDEKLKEVTDIISEAAA